MKRVLFIGITEYDVRTENPHLQKKFEGLSKDAHVFVISRGRPFYARIWNSEFYLLPRLFYFPLALITAIFVCLFHKIDTIVCQGPLTEGLIGAILKIICKKELIVEIHGDWREGPFLNKKRVFRPLLERITPFFANFSFARADKIRGVAEYFLMDLRKKFPSKQYFVFPTFSDLDLFFATPPKWTSGGSSKNDSTFQYICTVAVLSPIKNIETLIRAFAEVNKKFPELKLVVIGDGPSKESLQNLTDDLFSPLRLERGGELVVFTGRLPPEEVRDIVKDSYAFVLSSLSEGLPRVLLEAMALAKPVIATNVGGIPEIVRDGENGLLMEPKDIPGLAEKIEYLVANPVLAQKMGEAGRLFAQENFSNEKYIRNYITMIKQISRE